MNVHVLAYHSHHVVGDDYAHNDHIALHADLQLIHDAGYRVVSLGELIDALERPAANPGSENECRYVAITFDDGPMYDVLDFMHPRFGHQRGFLSIFRAFIAKNGILAQPGLHATSFVIASPEARKTIETTYDAEYTFVGPGAMTDTWWNNALASGLIAIANHSWDHLHPALPKVAHSKQVRADFTQVLSEEDADAQIADAGAYIAKRTNGKNAPFFAYPFGQYNSFLTNEYLPTHCRRLGLRAAFTSDALPIIGHDNPWCLPRYICGHHWTSPDQLLSILAT